jgi:hypothetical protein
MFANKTNKTQCIFKNNIQKNLKDEKVTSL